MKHAHTLKRAMAVLLALVMTLSLVTPSWAAGRSTVATKGENNGITWEKVDNIKLPIKENAAVEEEAQQQYADTDMVRVSIVLSDPSTLDKGFSASDIASGSKKAMKYRDKLESKQDKMVKTISKKALDGQALDVVWNLTLATNIISANVQYGQIEKIENVKGVKQVLIETRYEPCVVKESETTDPNMATSSNMIGSNFAWANGYTGAGSKVAIIDTGADTDHPSLSGAAYSYAVKGLGITPVTSADYADKLEKLNAFKKNSDLKASDLYVSAKIPFGFNYIDADLDVTHDNDKEGDHGSHVTGIAAGNRYIEQADGSFAPALDTALTQGVAPDAQVYTMKVFGKGGGAYDSDYMAAIEDAMILGCDSANLSLGSGNPGMSRQSDAKYQAILEAVVNSGMVVAMSAGNSGHWFENTPYAYPYAESVSWATNGSPGSYTNSLGVASVDNDGATGNFVEVAGNKEIYSETSGYTNLPMTTIAGEHEFVYVDAGGTEEDFAAVADLLKGKIGLCNRGTISFYEKGENAVAAGAIATIIVNNQAGTINMDLSDYTKTEPCVSVTQAYGETIKANAEKHTTDSGLVYYTGKMTVGAKPGSSVYNSSYYTMSDFSSWGIPGSLELKPEITAPGGNIYSLQNGGGYQNMSGTSMASPQVAGMAAVVAQYVRANKLTEKTGLTARALAQSLLMSTAVPMYQDYGEGKDGYYPVMQQGAGLANVGAATSAGTYILMDKGTNAGAADGKVKVELGDDPQRTGEYSFGFTINNLKDIATSFNLSADFFTQDVFANQFEDGSVVNFEDTYTTDLSSNVTWTVDGQVVEMTAPEGLANCDFNGDGKVTKADGQALLDFVTGVLDSISNKDNADFDNDGNIDTYDAYLFFQQLSKCTVEIPANGSVHVEVNAKVLGLDEYDKASDNTGTYVEGYVYANELASDEGVKGDSHSIPVLGYYGSWTDPSMFDIGSYLEYQEAHSESRVPYMYAASQSATKYQGLTVQYAGDPFVYYFGGNPYVDETYDPNRASINPDTTVFVRATFSLIRNAADARVTITGENGNVYYDKASGSPTASAYYYSNGAAWRNAQGNIGLNTAPTAAANGEKITVKVTEAPEYYVTYNADGTHVTNWDALGDGASRSYTAFIDRTEPVLSNVYFREDAETGARSLVLTAQDDRYVSAAFLFNYDEMKVLARAAGSPEGAALGAATDISLDLSKAEDVDHLYIQVCDYADNKATYKINLNKEELNGPVSVTLDKQSVEMYKGGTAALNAEVSPFGVHPDGVTWKSSDETVATVNARGIVTGVNKGTATITAASIKDPTATASCTVTVKTVDTTLVGALMDTNGDAQFFTWDLEHDATWKKLVNFETTKSVSASTFDTRTGNVYLQDGSFNINKMDLDTGKTLATYPGFEGEIPMWDMEYSLVYSTEAKPMLASVYNTYFLAPKPVDNLDLSAFSLGLYLWLYGDASYFTAVTSLGANKIDTDKDGVKDTDTELFLALDDAGNIWTMNVYPSVDKETGEDSWSASFGILESNLANVGYVANPTDDGDLYDSLYATVEGQELVLYLSTCDGNTSNVYRILLNEDTGKWEAAQVASFGDGVWPATLVGSMYHANEDTTEAVNAAMSKTTVHTTQAVEMTSAQIQRYNGAETKAASGSLNASAPTANVVNLPMGDAAENASTSKVTVSADEKTVTVDVIAKDAATNGLFNVDYDAANLTLTNVSFNTQYSSHKDEAGKVTLGYVDLNGVTAGSTVATLTFTVNDPTALDKINVTVTETQRNDQTVNNAETLAADLHTETETVNAKAATCTEDGYTGDVVCKACGKVITKGEVIPATGHDTEIVGAKEPTCTEDGYTGDEVCKTCGVTVKKGEVIPALGHKIKLVGAKEPTCTEDGYTGDEVCTICGEIVKKGEVIPALGHKIKLVGAKEPTCTEDGYTGDEVCTICGEIVKKGEVIPALGHKIKLVGAKEPTCTEDGYTGDEVCTICGEIVKKGEVIKATGHQYKDGKCTVCGVADPNYKPGVKTGDESNTALWVLVMASAALLAAAVVVLPRKKHSR